MKKQIDINCDMGEGFPFDAEIMPFISSANIACGGHAGDATTIRNTIQQCIKQGVAAGAHPSYPDKENFGRIKMTISEGELINSIMDQVFLFDAIAKECGTKMHHIKLHGALYNLASNNHQLAEQIIDTFLVYKKEIYLYGLSGSVYNQLAREKGFLVLDEVFADRTYQSDACLTPRNIQGALIEDDQQAINQVLGLAHEQKVITLTGEEIAVNADTICIHGDGAHAVSFASLIHHELTLRNFQIQAPLL
jgi:UPF0271 protein